MRKLFTLLVLGSLAIPSIGCQESAPPPPPPAKTEPAPGDTPPPADAPKADTTTDAPAAPDKAP
jgi:hypothetical protein